MTEPQTTPEELLWMCEKWLKQFYAGKPLDMIQSEKLFHLLDHVMPAVRKAQGWRGLND